MKGIYLILSLVLSFMIFSCKTTNVEQTETVNQEILQQNEEDALITEDISEEPVVELAETHEQSVEEEEYERSTSNVAVSYDIFNSDKTKILKIISELNLVMEEMDYNSWETYLDDESINYWSKRGNLQVASSRLPIKNIRLTSLRDYFIHIFLPSHKGYRIDEIRYETESLIKAVQVDDKENRDIVFYTFYKTADGFKLHLPSLQD